MWEGLARGSAADPYAMRLELLHNIDPSSGQQALRSREYKLLRGVPPSGRA